MRHCSGDGALLWGWGIALGMGHCSEDGALLSQETPWMGPRGELLYWGTRKMRFFRDMQNAL